MNPAAVSSCWSIMEILFLPQSVHMCAWDLYDDMQDNQLGRQLYKKRRKKNNNSYQTEQKNEESGLLLVDLNDHWFPLKVLRWNEWTDCEMLHLVSKVDVVQRTGLIPLYICVSLRVPARAPRCCHSSNFLKKKKKKEKHCDLTLSRHNCTYHL